MQVQALLKVQIKYQHVSERLTVDISFQEVLYDTYSHTVKCKRNVPTEQKNREVGMGFSEWEV